MGYLFHVTSPPSAAHHKKKQNSPELGSVISFRMTADRKLDTE